MDTLNTDIRVKKLDFKINDIQILNDISFSVCKNEVVGIIGPNGCGKSTLLKNIYRHYKPTGGVIFIKGDNIFGLKNKEIAKRLAVVSQENNLEFDFSVIDVVSLGRYAHSGILNNNSKDDEDHIMEALRSVGMQDFADRSFLSLSGGEKQRVYMAMALAQKSEIIILDEPTNHLDIGYQMLLMEMIHDMKDVTVLMSVHDMNLAAWYCDRIIVLLKGKIIEEGIPENVLTRELIRKVFHVDSEVVTRSGDNRMQVNYLNYFK